jgi:hypothetical protein
LLEREQEEIPEDVGIRLPIGAVILGEVVGGIVEVIEDETAREVVGVVEQRRFMDEEKRQGKRAGGEQEESDPWGVRFLLGLHGGGEIS